MVAAGDWAGDLTQAGSPTWNAREYTLNGIQKEDKNGSPERFYR